MADVDSMLARYAEQLLQSGDVEKTLAAVQLFRNAGRFLDAAKLLFQMGEEERARRAPPTRLKRLFVLAALLVERHRDQRRKGALQMSSYVGFVTDLHLKTAARRARHWALCWPRT